MQGVLYLPYEYGTIELIIKQGMIALDSISVIKEQMCDVCHKMWQLGRVAAVMAAYAQKGLPAFSIYGPMYK